MSQSLESLALDFASFHNISDPEAMQRFISALSGSSEVLDRFGINIKQAALQQELLNTGVRTSWQQVTEQQKAVARLSVIMRAMTDQGAVGDAVRTAGSFANRMKALKGQIHDTAVEIGNALLPVVTPIVAKLAAAGKKVAEWIAQNKSLIVGMAKIVAIVGAAGIGLLALGSALAFAGFALGGIATVATTVVGAFALVKGALLLLISPMGIVAAVWAVVVVDFLRGTGALTKAMSWLGRVFDVLKSDALAAFGGIKDALAAGDWKLAAKIVWLTLKMEFERGILPLRRAWEDFVFGLKAAWEIAMHAIADSWWWVVRTVKTAWANVKAFFLSSFEKIVSFLAGIVGKVISVFDKSVDADVLQKELKAATRERLADIQSEKDAALAGADAEYERRRRAEDELHRQRMADIGKEGAERVAAAEGALKKARQEWEDALALATGKRKAAGAQGTEGPPGVGPGQDVATRIEELLRGLTGGGGAGVRHAETVAGTFGAYAIGGLGGGNAMDRTARATEETAKQTRKLVDQAAMTQPTFT